MKRFIVAVSVVILVLAVFAWAQTPVPKPGAEHKRVEVFAGHWTYVGEYVAGPLGPGGKVTGEYTAQMILGGFFLQGRWVEKGPAGDMRGVEIFGYDPAAKTYSQSQYQDDGSIGSGAYADHGNVWSYAGTMLMGGKRYMVRNEITLAADLMSIVGKGEISVDGKAWVPFVNLTYAKAKPVPKK
jgi:roadblock/LC7 domain-containing protein